MRVSVSVKSTAVVGREGTTKEGNNAFCHFMGHYYAGSGGGGGPPQGINIEVWKFGVSAANKDHVCSTVHNGR